ncbi:MAG: YggT family protein [Candidatus Melainabacteria bacterium]|nr:MAG: YggT family protein [Candidatus Melainabacteria bacterium]
MFAARVLNNLFYFYFLLIMIRIFLSWIPSIDWFSQPFKSIREVTDLYLDLFRRLIPPVGGLDFSPIIAIIALQIIQSFTVGLLLKVLS